MALTSKGHFKIGSTEFKAKSIQVTIDSLASPDSGRTDDGTMRINWVLNRMRKVEIEMAPSTSNSVLNLVQGKTYNLTYFDPITNAEKTIQCYTSNVKGELYNGVLYNGIWQGVKFSAIEIGGENA